MTNWHITDIFDLDYFLTADGQSAPAASQHQRDRDWYLQVTGNTPARNLNQSRCLRIWLDRMRALHLEYGEPGPGVLFARALSMLRLTLIVLAIFCGIAAGLSYFAYTGTTALNIFSFLALFVLPQLLLVILFLVRGSLARLAGKKTGEIQKLLPALLLFIGKKMGRRRPYFEGASSIDVTLLAPKLLTYSQLFGVIFNIALLGVTLFKVTTSDLAFGWQTTLQIGPEKLFSLVEAVAAPWALFLSEGAAHPTLAEIEGSRIILKDGILNLATENLVSWWPFLLLCLLFYGLLPRVLLLISTLLLERRFIKGFIQKKEFQQICNRMQTPVVTTQAEPEPPISSSDDQPGTTAEITPAESSAGMDREVVLLVPAEVIDKLDGTILQAALAEQGYDAAEMQPIFRDYDNDRELLARLDLKKKPLVIIMEAWMPPIREQLIFLRDAVQSVQPDKTRFILLGKPDGSNYLTRANQQDTEVWQNHLTKLGGGVGFLKLTLTGKGEK